MLDAFCQSFNARDLNGLLALVLSSATVEIVHGPAVRCVMTFETDGQNIAHVRNYFFSPDVIAEVCSELGLPYRVNGYHYW